jgi:hypothetical protein
MHKHHVPAVIAAGVNTAAILADSVVTAVTGEHTFFVDDTQGNTATTLASALVLGATFGLMALVVHREAHRFAEARRVARIARPVLMGGLVFLAAGFFTIYPLQTLIGLDSGPVYDASGTVAFAALCATFLSAFVLGLALIGRNPLGVGGRLLAAIGPVVLLTVLLGLVAPAVASPVFITATLLGGLALLGVGAPSGHPARQRRSAVELEATP